MKKKGGIIPPFLIRVPGMGENSAGFFLQYGDTKKEGFPPSIIPAKKKNYEAALSFVDLFHLYHRNDECRVFAFRAMFALLCMLRPVLKLVITRAQLMNKSSSLRNIRSTRSGGAGGGSCDPVQGGKTFREKWT